jgi:hypothetical protein
MAVDSEANASEGQCPISRVRIDTLDAMQAMMRSKAVVQDADVVTGNYMCPNSLAAVNADEFMRGNLAMINGDLHRQRRRLLNMLVRPWTARDDWSGCIVS